MRVTAVLLAATAIGGGAAAQEGLRATDRLYGQAELVAMLSDAAVEYYDGSG